MIVKDGLVETDSMTLEGVLASVGPNSLDVHLGQRFMRILPPKDGVIDLRKKQEYETTILENENEQFILPANGFALATTTEVLNLPADMCALVDGRSTTGRLGLVVETAGMINAGFVGTITLELKNVENYPIILRAGDSVAQIRFEQLDRPTSRAYRGVYQNQRSTTEPFISNEAASVGQASIVSGKPVKESGKGVLEKDRAEEDVFWKPCAGKDVTPRHELFW